MSFDAVIKRFEGSNCDFTTFANCREERVRETLGPNSSLDRLKLMRRWNLGYDVLRSVWDSTRTLPSETRSQSVVKNRLHLLFLNNEDIRSFLIFSRENVGAKNPGEYSIDAIMEYLLFDLKKTEDLSPSPICRKAPYPLFNDFIEQMTTEKPQTVDDAIVESCKCDDGLFIGDFYRLAQVDLQPDPNKSSTLLELLESNGELHFAVNRVTTDPIQQKKRVFQDLEALRANKLPEYGDKPVQGLSWLMRQGNERFLRELELLGEGVQIDYYDINQMFKPVAEVPAAFTDSEKYKLTLYISLLGITLSRSKLRRFLTHGLLPDVGTITIPSDIFFRQNSFKS